MAKKIKFAVIGSPISHSRSPEIHLEFASQARLDIEFNKVELSKSNLDDWVHSFFLEGGKGLSVTLPFKEDCLGLADEVSQRVNKTKAINVLLRPLVVASEADRDLVTDLNLRPLGTF